MRNTPGDPDVLAARETLRYSEAFLAGITQLVAQAEDDLRKAEAGPREDDSEARERVRAARNALGKLRSEEGQARYRVR